jgi:LysM repeat protein
MKILQIFGAVVAVHLLAFIFIFASPGCHSGPRNAPTPDATMPPPVADAPATYGSSVTPQPIDLGTPPVVYNPASPSGHAAPTRPGSADAVVVTPPKPVANVAPVSTYTVERGDSLWSISKKYSLTVAELAKANNITTGTALKPGRKLIIPGKPGAAVPEAATADKPAVAAPARNGEVVKHTVQTGESLGVIARKYQVTVGELAAANNITDPSKVRAGQQLVIPGFKAVPGKSPVATKPATTPAAPATTPAETPAEPAASPSSPQFELTAPPPGQDLDAGLKPSDTDVPTIKVEEPAPPSN